jgi:hypothetical protein
VRRLRVRARRFAISQNFQKKLVTGESTHTKSDLNKTIALFNPLPPLAVDMPPAPQMRRTSTEAMFDGCMERFRPIMMTNGSIAWRDAPTTGARKEPEL